MKVLIRGNPDTLGRRGPAAVPGRPGRRRRRRSRRAAAGSSWPEPIASPDNPLTARVMVNRVWQHHFGRGLVAHAEQLRRAGRAAHASRAARLPGQPVRRRRLVAQGAAPRDHAVGRRISRASRVDARAREVDPDNALLWRMNRRRLEVEAWRDAMLAVAGTLDRDARRAVGRPRSTRQPPPHALRARSAGTTSTALLRLFDFPDPNITSDGRADDDRAAAAAVRAQQRVHGPQRQGAGRPAGRSRAADSDDADAHPPRLPAALRPRRRPSASCSSAWRSCATDDRRRPADRKPDAAGSSTPRCCWAQRVHVRGLIDGQIDCHRLDAPTVTRHRLRHRP